MANDLVGSTKIQLLKEHRDWAISLLNHWPISASVYRDWHIATSSAIRQAFGELHGNVHLFKEASNFDLQRTADEATMRRWLEVQKSLLDDFINQLGHAGTEDDVPKRQTKIFLVHGHDPEIKETVARFLQNLGLESIILAEQAHRGRTIIQQIETYTDDVPFAVVLLTPDDIGEAKDRVDQLKPRARQNVILELGFLMGKLGRSNVCAIRKGDVEIPSDFQGILWTNWEQDWKLELIRDLRDAKIDIDLDKI